MSLSSVVKVIISGDSHGAVNALKDVENAAKGHGSKLATFAKVGAAGFAAVGVAAAAFAVDAIHAGDALNESQDLLQNALKDTHQKVADVGAVIGPVQKKMEGWGYTNLDVNDGLTMLVKAGDKLTTATKDVALAADIAKGRHISLADAEKILVKVRTGHVSLLGRYGIAIKDSTGKVISQNEAIKRLSALYKGDAQTASESLAGKTAALKAKFENIKAHIGQFLIPILLKLASWIVTTVIPAIGKAAHWVTTVMIPALVAFGKGVVTLYNKYIAPYVADIVKVIRGLATTIDGIMKLISDIFHGHWSHIWADIRQIVSGLVQTVVGYFSSLKDGIGRILVAVGQLAGRKAAELGRAIVSGIVNEVKALPGQLFDIGRQIVQALVNGVKSLGGLVGDALRSLVPGPLKSIASHIPGHSLLGFAQGGIVPGAVGAPMLALVHGGEEVLTPRQRAGRGGGYGGGGNQYITVYGANDPRTIQRLQDKWNRRNGIVPVTSP